MSTKFPASAVLMELAAYMRKMSLRTVAEWAPRDGNKEADKLANGNAEDFEPSLRIDVDASTLCWDILPEALEGGGAAERQSQEARERGTLPNRSRKEKRRGRKHATQQSCQLQQAVLLQRPSFSLSLSSTPALLCSSPSWSTLASFAVTPTLRSSVLHFPTQISHCALWAGFVSGNRVSEERSGKSSELSAHQISLGSSLGLFLGARRSSNPCPNSSRTIPPR